MQREIIDYMIVTEFKAESLSNGVLGYDLSNIVRGWMKEGWQPLGGVSYSPAERSPMQAMVKYKETECNES